MRLDPASHFDELVRHQQKVRQVEKAEGSRKGSMTLKVTRKCMRQGRDNQEHKLERDSVNETIRHRLAVHDALKEMEGCDSGLVRRRLSTMQEAALRATRSIYGVVLLSIMPVLGITLIALTIS